MISFVGECVCVVEEVDSLFLFPFSRKLGF